MSIDSTDVAIIGAGPYGLSVAAHLAAADVEFRIFGKAMDSWLNHMPQGMRLKSEGFASDLYEPNGSFRLADYCRRHGIAYADTGLPVALETFSAYGLAFQRKFVPQLEDRTLVSLQRDGSNFALIFADGTIVLARRVVLAVGISHFDHVPAELATLPHRLVSHSSRHRDLSRLRGRRVIVFGGGSSAVDTAGLLLRAGAQVELVARRPKLTTYPPEREPRSLLSRLRRPQSGLGPNWKSRLYSDFPHLFYALPERMRLKIVRTHLGPAPAWIAYQDINGKMPLHLGWTLERAAADAGGIQLHLTRGDGDRLELNGDHVIAATGYRVDLSRLTFLAEDLREQIQSIQGAPFVSRTFESTVSGLFFVGVAAANNFGPLLRFAYGARFSARRISSYLGSTRSEIAHVADPEPSYQAG